MMMTEITKTSNLTTKGFKLLLLSILILGIIFRVVNIDSKTYWFDEVFTSLRASGFTESEIVQQINNKELINSKDIQIYQYSNSNKSFGDVINSLALEDPQHPPLYFLMSKVWVNFFGNTVEARRSLSVVASLFVFPLIYWLSLELFNSSLVGLVAMDIVAISPFHILYAQEARQYSLWTAMILLLSATLLWAMRKKSNYIWMLYSLFLALSCYTFLFSIHVAIAHGIYVFIVEGRRLSKVFIKYLTASILGMLAFTPWLLSIINNISHVNKITGGFKNLSGIGFYSILVKEWLVNLSHLFIDFGSNFDESFSRISPENILLLIVIISGLFLSIYGIYFTCQNSQRQTWLFIIILIGVNAIAIILPDLILGDSRSKVSRYFIPAYLGIQIAFSYFITNIIYSFFSNSFQRDIRILLVIIFFMLGIFSCAVNKQTKTSWIKMYGQHDLASYAVNQFSHPLIVDFGYTANLISLSYYINTKVEILAELKCYTCSTKPSQVHHNYRFSSVFDQFSDVFLFDSSLPLEDSSLPLELKNEYKLTPVLLSNNSLGKSVGSELWRITKKTENQ